MKNKSTYRRMALKMGAWKWGYPRGERIGITRYVQRKDLKGVLRWWSDELVCDGLTAANEALFIKSYPDAFSHIPGSLHRSKA